jgi:3-oxoacyl-[acyl-carrier protein] reductase
VITYANANNSPAVEGLILKIENLGNGAKAISICVDLRKPESANEIVKATLQGFPPPSVGEKSIDILVNNAAMEANQSIADFTLEDFDNVFYLNVRAPMLLVAEVLPHLRRPGRIINISSPAARHGIANAALYGSSKAAIEAMTRCLATELGKEGHIVNAVAPGGVMTDMLATASQSMISWSEANTPLGNRLGTVEEIADVVATMAEHSTR